MKTIFKMGHHAKAIAFPKSLTLAQKLKFQKTCKNPFYKSFRVLLCTECYSLCMMAEFGNLISGIFRVFSSKFFLQDHSKRFVKSFRVVLCKKTVPKNTKYSINENIFKMGHHAKAIASRKILTWAKKLNFQKTCQNRFYKSFRVVQCKKPLDKHTKYSRNETIFKMGHHANAIAFAKSSLWLKN